jgi:hypothetical protein
MSVSFQVVRLRVIDPAWVILNYAA